MEIWLFSALVAAGSFAAGFLGSLTGLGGGVIVVPMLTLALGVDIRYAIGASLVSVIGTSSGAAAAYVREGYSNVRIGLFLEIATSIGALMGAFLAGFLSTSVIAIVFGVVLLHSAYLSLRKGEDESPGQGPPDRISEYLRLDGDYPSPTGPIPYRVRRVPAGFGVMVLAGVLSGLLGIGSGALKVIAMDHFMRLPFKVSTTTSNFMIGVTAAASAGIYLGRGYIDPRVAMPVMLGVLTGAFFGARALAAAPTRILRLAFGVVIVIVAIEMIYNGVAGRV